MYDRTYWQDHVTSKDAYTLTKDSAGDYTITKAGTVMQQGTPQDETHFNNSEVGLEDVNVAGHMMINAYRHQKVKMDAFQEAIEAEVLGEVHTVTLTNTASQPFNTTVDTPVSVALDQVRNNLYYSVETDVTEHTGLVGEILITDKTLNGFKISFTGSGTSVTLALRIKGGMA